MESLNRLLLRSNEFADYLCGLQSGIDFPNLDPRKTACAHAADLSAEHAHAVRTLIASRTGNSACVVLRAQYEALIRSAWAMYAATDLQVEKLNLPLGPEAEQAAKNLPGAMDMLTTLQRRMEADPALSGLVIPLTQIHEASWRALNSFVHGGLHPVQRVRAGFPVQLARHVVLSSNGMMHMAHRMIARLGASTKAVVAVERGYLGFEDCLPMVEKARRDDARSKGPLPRG